MKPLKGLVDVLAVRRNVLIRELCKRGVEHDIAAVTAYGYVHSDLSNFRRWSQALRSTKLSAHRLNDALKAAGLRS